jgi:hypothetical protein
MRSRSRRILPPHQVNETIGRNDLIGMEKKDGENRTLLRGSKFDRNPIVQDLERTEDPELHTALPRFLPVRCTQPYAHVRAPV